MRYGRRRIVLMATGVRTFHLDKFCAKIVFVLYTQVPFVTQVVSRMDDICTSTVAFKDGPSGFRWEVSRMYAMAVTGIVIITLSSFVSLMVQVHRLALHLILLDIITYRILNNVPVRCPYTFQNFACINTFPYV